MLPVVLVICGIALCSVGFWPAGIFCFVGALIGRSQDKNVENLLNQAEALGCDVSSDRMQDSVFNWGCAAALLFVALGVVAISMGWMK